MAALKALGSTRPHMKRVYEAGEIETRSKKGSVWYVQASYFVFKRPMWGQKGACSGCMGYKFASSTETIAFLSEKVQ